MVQFADEAVITVISGKGGNGCIAFRREKYIPNGGPNGGDGGRGGNVVFCVKKNLRTLAHLRFHPIFKAKAGQDGMGWNRYGKDGDDVVIPFPPGTVIKDNETGAVLYDFSSDTEESFVFLEGGKGGWGNVHFKSSTNQAPRYAHPGKPGIERTLKVELAIMADVGLVGFPNAGKSSLLNAFTNARAKIAPYPFTTKIPNLGVLRVDEETDLIIADIPGIIEGAAEGAGLGIRFLKHISRTECLLFMIDCSEDSALEAYPALLKELEQFGGNLAQKKRIVLCNKIDKDGAKERAQAVRADILKTDSSIPVLFVSVLERINMGAVRSALIDMVFQHEKEKKSAECRATHTTSGFLAERSVDSTMEEQFPGSE